MNKKRNKAGTLNVFKDLGLPNAEEHFIKAQLVFKIDTLMKERDLKQIEAAALLGIKQPDVSKMLRGEFRQFSVERYVREVAHGIVRQLLVERRGDRLVDPENKDRVAVGRRFRRQLGPEQPARSRAIVDDDGLAQVLAQFRRENPRDDIRCGGGAKRDDDAHRPGGIGVAGRSGLRVAGGKQDAANACCPYPAGDIFSTVRLHFLSPSAPRWQMSGDQFTPVAPGHAHAASCPRRSNAIVS